MDGHLAQFVGASAGQVADHSDGLDAALCQGLDHDCHPSASAGATALAAAIPESSTKLRLQAAQQRVDFPVLRAAVDASVSAAHLAAGVQWVGREQAKMDEAKLEQRVEVQLRAR